MFCVYRIVHAFIGLTCFTPVSEWCSYCSNGGTCVDVPYGMKCQCTRFWTGPQCKEPITCRDMPCKQATMCRDYVSFGFVCPYFVYLFCFSCLSLYQKSFLLISYSLVVIFATANLAGQDRTAESR